MIGNLVTSTTDGSEEKGELCFLEIGLRFMVKMMIGVLGDRITSVRLVEKSRQCVEKDFYHERGENGNAI